MPPRVTVIIPTYNWSSVLPYSIGSVLGQTFTDFELLVVGDGAPMIPARSSPRSEIGACVGSPRRAAVISPDRTTRVYGRRPES